MADFAIGTTDFLMDGQPFRVLSGAMHYFRVHPDQWADRIHKARLMGLNTIETYVAWNAHSPRPGSFDTFGQLDLDRFLRLIADEGMYAIVRPGPFICAEWDNGGFPGWLFRDPSVGVRTSEPLYVAAVTDYLRQVLEIVEPLQVQHGGPVILVQIENEYGAYGDDKEYLQTLVDVTRAAGIRVPLTTIDQPTDQMLADGSLPELHKTGSFGSRSRERLDTLRRHQPTGPLMCAEFWDGWFDHWGDRHHVTPVDEAAHELDELLAAGASVNIYMFHGGTNFGFTNGANDKGVYQPTVTSYDYDAPLDEAGNPTAKYWAFRDVIAKYSSVPKERPAEPSPAPQFAVPLRPVAALFDIVDSLGQWRHSSHLPTADDVDNYRGFTLYRTELADAAGGVLEFADVRDRAQVFLDGRAIGILNRDFHERAIVLPQGRMLELLVEDQGRVNYGQKIGEHKGLIGPARLGDTPLERWSVMPLPFDSIDAVLGNPLDSYPAGPAFLLGVAELDDLHDLFLSTEGWGKGVVWINGLNLGRFWGRGPQSTLYVPASVLRVGKNEIVVLELQVSVEPTATFVSEARLGHTEA